MISRLRYWALAALAAGLLGGSAAWAQTTRTVQTDPVRYALALEENPDAANQWRFRVAVSIPREGADYGIPVAAVPSRLMFRAHKGDVTAFDGSILLSRLLPADAGRLYPMPQSGDTPDTDGVESGDAEALAALDDGTVAAPATDPLRWEAVYVSDWYDSTDTAAANALLDPLLEGQATHEWYAASRYGIGSFTRISDIQDAGRKQTFRDARLWAEASGTYDWAGAVDDATRSRWGSVYDWQSVSMTGAPWEIHGGVVNVNNRGVDGVHLLGIVDEDAGALPCLVSPVYPDGVSAVTFKASLGSGAAAGETPRLDVQVLDTSSGAEAWTTVASVTGLTNTHQTFTVSLGDALPAGSNGRFRIVRATPGGNTHTGAIAINDLLVRSASPTADFSTPGFSPDPLYPRDGGWQVVFQATSDDARGYSPEIALRRRADGDDTAQWHAAADVSVDRQAAGDTADLTASFLPGTLETYSTGAVNAVEGAFFTDSSGAVTGLLPGVYDLRLTCDVLGSFAAGRENIDEHETVRVERATYDVTQTDDDGQQVVETHPFVVDLRERETAHAGVVLEATYRVDGEGRNEYAFFTREVEMLPSSADPNVWRVDVQRVLRLEEDETAVWAWAPDDLIGQEDPTDQAGEENILSFRIRATAPDGSSVTYYGQTLQQASATLPPTLTAVPSSTATLASADAPGRLSPLAVPLNIANSHVAVEVTLADAAPAIVLRGSYWQDFNSWFAVSEEADSDFSNTDFRENVASVTAGFDVRDWGHDSATDERTIAAGWMPDEGPFARTTSITDAFGVARRTEQTPDYAFYYRDTSDAINGQFAQWGAASDPADPGLLRADDYGEDGRSQYFDLDGGAEVVLRRTYSTLGDGTMMPDAAIRLTPTASIEPSASVKLNGVGTVSFDYTLSIPYDFSGRVQLVQTETPGAFPGAGYGIAAGIPSNASQTYSPSGVSVSYYLEDVWGDRAYELRLTEVVDFPSADFEAEPTSRVYAELYRWNGSTATRLRFQDSGDGYAAQLNHSHLAGHRYGLWVNGDRRLVVGVSDSATGTTITATTHVSSETVSVPTGGFRLALNSAECRPTFRYVAYATASGDLPTEPLLDGVAKRESNPPGWATSGAWTLGTENDRTAITLTRVNPPSDTAGRFVLRVQPESGARVDYPFYASSGATQTGSFTVGQANATVSLLIESGASGVYLDNVTVTSWCGDDTQRNGDNVPDFTDLGFSNPDGGGGEDANGFAAVGVWVRPEDDAQLTVSKDAYEGRQVLVMQRSRKNTNGGEFSEGLSDGGMGSHWVTGASLALYTPHNRGRGFGSVSFRYRIPQTANGGSGSAVRLLLQFREDNNYTNDYLGSYARDQYWVDVSSPILLSDTSGDWATVSVVPRFASGDESGQELVGRAGTLRLVMLIPDEYRDNASYDPCVWLDDVTVTDNRSGVLASWAAGNAKLTTSPVDLLYWKDRAAAGLTDQVEQTFAERAGLTKALHLNDAVVNTQVSDAYLESPALENGVGRLTFAARLAASNPTPVRLYVSATTSTDEDLTAEDFTVLASLDVTNTVYRVYDLDLAAATFADAADDTVTHKGKEATRLRLWTVPRDFAGAIPDAHPASYGQVLIDRLAIEDPVAPSLRVTDVAFSNDASGAFDSKSPLSQPVSGATDLRVQATLGNKQRVKPGSVRVFYSFATTEADALRATAGYTYTDALGGDNSAGATRPIYRFQNAAQWNIGSWLGEIDPAAVAAATDVSTLYPNTLELTGDADETTFTGSLAQLFPGLLTLPPNSLVRYAVWAIYQAEAEEGQSEAEANEWYCSVIDEADYTEFPWYFPRNLNAEMQARDAAAGFSPYYWVYSCVPGEAFINEFNLTDAGTPADGADLASFIELCFPATLDIDGWGVAHTVQGGITNGNYVPIDVAEDAQADMNPDAGVVPARRAADSSSNRTFYTVANGVSFTTEDAKNAGWAKTDNTIGFTGTNYGVAVYLYRPTGGAEHIVVFSSARASTVAQEQQRQNVADTYNDILGRTAPFGGTWSQAFLDTTWQAEIDAGLTDEVVDEAPANDPIGLIGPETTPAEMHGRRLAVAETFQADANGDYAPGGGTPAYVQDNDDGNAGYANSIATVDMGGKWVTRRNKINEASVADLTHLTSGNPLGFNPTQMARAADDGKNYQVTPRQINLDQWLIPYTGLSRCAVVSRIEGGLGRHTLKIFDSSDPDSTEVTDTRRGGVDRDGVTWTVGNAGSPHVNLIYDALPYHHIASVRIRLRDSVSGSYLGTQAATEAGLPALDDQVGVAIGAPDADGWAEVTVGSDLTQIEIPLQLYVTTEGEVRFTAEAVATFALSQETDGGQVITSVRPYVGEPSGADRPDAPPAMAARRNQPWRGSGFGFEVGYTAPVGAELSSVLVFYPDPDHVGETDLDAAWVGDAALRGFNDVDNGPLTAEAIAAALNATDPDDPASTPAGVSVVQLNTAADGWFYGASGVPILGTAYGETGEPLIPFVAWGVYTVTFPTDSGTQTVSFLLRQAVNGETAAGAADPFAFPEWYKPLTQESIALPYFYLYATPPESVWLNEVNLAQGSGSATYAEVVFPVLRAGIVEAGVPQATPDGWKLRTYNNEGTAAGADIDLSGLTLTESGSASYAYAIAENIATPADTTAYVVIRPCGAAEGGVWTGVDATGGTAVTPGTLDLINVFPGVTDSSAEAGSVQLVGQLTTATDPNAVGGISSVAAERTEWAFEAESRGADNDAIRPDTDPDWNRVTFLTVIRNATYGSGTCGTWLEGYFATEGATGQSGSGAVSKAGPEWVYDPVTDNAQNVFSYKPRAGYCFESIQLPPELIGHVMLVGQEGEALTATQVKDLYERNIDAYEAALTPEAKAAVASGAWLTPSGSSVTVDAATGLVTFDRDSTAPNDDTGETFADKDDFIVTLLFVDEPASAQGTVTVSFAQGETGAGAWLATQTFYALDAAGNPIYDQGGEVVVGEDGTAANAKPIWDDETGNAEGAHKNVHGWLHQPLVGDRLGMAAVLTPSFGLIGGNSPLGASEAEAYAAFDAGTVRPFLVWALTPAGQVPDDLFTGSSAARRNFLSQWALGQWVGATPAIADGITTSFSGLRTRLQSAIGGTYVTAAGIIPMQFLGRRGADGSIVETAPGDDEELRLAFRTMTQSEIEKNFQGGAATPDGQLPYATAIDMNGTGWANGAVLRFAIILADPAGNVVYDLQGIANFSSADFDGYCPWYVPDDRVNINAVSAREAAGVSPFAWVYDIAQDGVWLNEIRPFTHIPGAEADTATSYAVELAMEAAPVALRAADDAGQVTETVYDPWDSDLDGAAGTLIPQRSLTGWKVVTKVAELPQVDAPLDVPLEWDEVASIALHGWVPFRRIEPLAQGGQTNEDFYALDFYAIADEAVITDQSVSLGFRADSGVTQSNAYNGANENTFRWLPAPAPLDTLPEGIAGKVAGYTSGVLYAFALVRDNGAVVDEVLFQDQPANEIIIERLQRAVKIENATHAAAATVRGTYVPITMPSKAYAITSFQFVERTRTDLPDEEPALMWNYDGSNTSSANTLPGINGWKVKDSPLVFAQPRSNVLPGSGAAGASYSVSAQILGGDGSLALARNGLTPATGPAVSVSGILGDTYALSLEKSWNPDWFTLKSITRNGAPYDPAFLRPTTTFALNAAATGLSETRGAEIAEETISEDVDYVLSLGYTPDAERLSRAGALDSEDAAFEAWLRQVSPEEILAATAQDGVSANEKFWLGFGDAAVSATEVSLAITRIGTQTEGTGEGARTLPAISVALTNGDAPIDGVRGDGALLLLGTESLDAPEWRVVRRLHADDLNGERVLVLDTPCNFFRAILLSVRQANELPAE